MLKKREKDEINIAGEGKTKKDECVLDNAGEGVRGRESGEAD